MINKMIYTYNTHPQNNLQIKKGTHTTPKPNNHLTSSSSSIIIKRGSGNPILPMSVIIHAPKTGCSACGS